MRFATLRRPRAGDPLPGVTGPARVDRRTIRLATRLHPGDVAVIDHVDLDRAAAEALVAARVGAVVNVAPSISGRYPNLGPEIIVNAGIPLVDDVGRDAFAQIRDGDRVRVAEGVVYAGDGRVLATGTLQTEEMLERRLAQARAGLATQLEAFASDTVEYLRREHQLLLEGVGVPDIRTELDGRPTVVVARGHDDDRTLRALRRYVRDVRPVVIGVDAGADALLQAGVRPHLVVVSGADAVSDDALRCGAEIVVHTQRDAAASGLARLHEAGLRPVGFRAAGTTEDAALLLADLKGAALIVTVGSQATLEELLDKGRSGMASTFLTRLRLGGKLIDAQAVSRLHRTRVPAPVWFVLIVAMLIAFAVVLVGTPGGASYRDLFDARWHDVITWVHRLVT